MIIRTEYANFGKFKDLLRYMEEEHLEVITVRTEYWGAKLTPIRMTQKDVADVIQTTEDDNTDNPLIHI